MFEAAALAYARIAAEIHESRLLDQRLRESLARQKSEQDELMRQAMAAGSIDGEFAIVDKIHKLEKQQ